MAFGQSPGPPATSQQLRQLTELLEAAGHSGFRDARGPLGLNQRQAGGRFTRDEADEMIARLEAEQEASDAGVEVIDPSPARKQRTSVPRPSEARQGRSLRSVPSEVLAAELQRRGWAVIEP